MIGRYSPRLLFRKALDVSAIKDGNPNLAVQALFRIHADIFESPKVNGYMNILSFGCDGRFITCESK